jgi:PAS domain S-box-containing protein
MAENDFARRYKTMQRYVGWTDADARRVASLAALVEPRAGELVADFYAEIRRHPEAMRVVTGGSEQMARLSRTLRAWLAELLAGTYDDGYMARRWKVGHRHVEIGLAQRYTALAMSRLRSGIASCVEQEWTGDAAERSAALASLHKLLDLEHALIQDAYEYEHVRHERRLERERSERKFRRLVESASCLIVILNADRDVVYFNPCAQHTTGFGIDDLRRRRGSVIALLGADEGRTAARINAVLAGAGPATYEDQITCRSGAMRRINWTLSRIEDFDEGPSALAMGHDVTEARRIAEQLLQASRLATVGEMYAGLAHESRNALQRLRSCTDLLADQVADRPSAVALLERAQRAQSDLQQLLDEVRNYAAPIVLERTSCRLPNLWREAWRLVQMQHGSRRAELVDDGCTPPTTIAADRFRMIQVFRNIFENALSACGDPAVVRLSCREALRDGAAALEISVEDNGSGFAPGAIERAFEPFFTTKSSGTGLGLAIVRRIVEAHGGEATAARGVRGGARICLTLPIGEDP